MTPHFLVVTRTGRYSHAIRGAGRDFTPGRQSPWRRPICNRVPEWHDFFLAKKNAPPLCPGCAHLIHRMVDHDLATS
jgi:hypothetical protein